MQHELQEKCASEINELEENALKALRGGIITNASTKGRG